MVKADKCLYTLWHLSQVTKDVYLKRFYLQVAVFETFGGKLSKHPLIFKQKLIEAVGCDPNYASYSE